MTNGVSFSLVAGAIVLVYYQNSNSHSTKWTLNINSTGAKQVRIWEGDIAYSSNIATGAYRDIDYPPRDSLYVYTGSYYAAAGSIRGIYSDYSEG